MTRYLLWCVVCMPSPEKDDPMVFEDSTDRAVWAAVHTNALEGHHVVSVDIPDQDNEA